MLSSLDFNFINFGCVGLLTSRKGFINAIKAVKVLSNKYSNFQLFIYENLSDPFTFKII